MPLATREAIDYVRSLGGLKRDRRLASALLWRGRRLERGVRRRAGLSAWRRSRVRHAAASRHRAVDRRQPSDIADDISAGADRRAFRRRHHHALARGRRGPGRAARPATSRWWRWIAARSASCTAFRTTFRSMHGGGAPDLRARSSRWRSIASMARGGAATSARMPGRHSICPSGDISRRSPTILPHRLSHPGRNGARHFPRRAGCIATGFARWLVEPAGEPRHQAAPVRGPCAPARRDRWQQQRARGLAIRATASVMAGAPAV